MSDVQLALAIATVLFAAGLWMLLTPADARQDAPPPPKRDLKREHALGAHREMAAWGCRDCNEGKG